MQENQKSPETILPISSNQFKALGSKGGLARKNNLTPEQRSAISKKAGSAKGKKGLQKATHEGFLTFGETSVDCYVLNNGTRVISSVSIRNALGLSNPSSRERKKAKEGNLPTFLASDSLKPYVSSILEKRGASIYFISKKGQKTEGIDAKILPDICEAYLKARDDKNLPPQQLKTAMAAEIIIRSLAKIGIIALVDESTGFQEERARDELQVLLKKFINDDLLKWTQKFPHSFFRETYRILGWNYRPGQCHGPSYLGKFINKYVYDAISPEVHSALKDLNPVLETGKRIACFHQFLTENIGLPALDKHITSVITLLKISKTKEEFEENFKKLFPEKSSEQIDFFD